MYEANVLPLGKVSGGIGMEFGCRLFGRLYEAASAYVIQNTNGEGELSVRHDLRTGGSETALAGRSGTCPVQ